VPELLRHRIISRYESRIMVGEEKNATPKPIALLVATITCTVTVRARQRFPFQNALAIASMAGICIALRTCSDSVVSELDATDFFLTEATIKTPGGEVAPPEEDEEDGGQANENVVRKKAATGDKQKRKRDSMEKGAAAARSSYKKEKVASNTDVESLFEHILT
jgi:hypothetical protein